MRQQRTPSIVRVCVSRRANTNTWLTCAVKHLLNYLCEWKKGRERRTKTGLTQCVLHYYSTIRTKTSEGKRSTTVYVVCTNRYGYSMCSKAKRLDGEAIAPENNNLQFRKGSRITDCDRFWQQKTSLLLFLVLSGITAKAEEEAPPFAILTMHVCTLVGLLLSFLKLAFLLFTYILAP